MCWPGACRPGAGQLQPLGRPQTQLARMIACHLRSRERMPDRATGNGVPPGSLAPTGPDFRRASDQVMTAGQSAPEALGARNFGPSPALAHLHAHGHASPIAPGHSDRRSFGIRPAGAIGPCLDRLSASPGIPGHALGLCPVAGCQPPRQRVTAGLVHTRSALHGQAAHCGWRRREPQSRSGSRKDVGGGMVSAARLPLGCVITSRMRHDGKWCPGGP